MLKIEMTGPPAVWVGKLLDESDQRGRLAALPPSLAAEIRRIAAECRTVGAHDLATRYGGIPAAVPISTPPVRGAQGSAPTAVVESWLTVADVAQLLGLKPRRVRQLAAAGKYGAVLHKHVWRFDPEQVQERVAG